MMVAQSGLGILYAMGIGVGRDAVQAVAWYRKAAQGDAKAQYELLRMRPYLKDLGGCRDERQASRKVAEEEESESADSIGMGA